jgi:hypothetical protein
MAARDTFEWLVSQFWPKPSPEEAKFIHQQRRSLMNIRNENERERFIQDFLAQLRESKKRRMSS